MTSNSKNINYHIKKPDTIKTDVLEIIEYTYKGKPIHITIEQPEYTSVCPMTGLPDYGTIIIQYTPEDTLVELKSLKFYLLQFRIVGIFSCIPVVVSCIRVLVPMGLWVRLAYRAGMVRASWVHCVGR